MESNEKEKRTNISFIIFFHYDLETDYTGSKYRLNIHSSLSTVLFTNYWGVLQPNTHPYQQHLPASMLLSITIPGKGEDVRQETERSSYYLQYIPVWLSSPSEQHKQFIWRQIWQFIWQFIWRQYHSLRNMIIVKKHLNMFKSRIYFRKKDRVYITRNTRS